jgi:hypothetical protein
MPLLYRPVRRVLPTRYDTSCRMFVGKEVPFSRGSGLRYQELQHPSTTLLVAEASEPVVWTEPDELRYQADSPLPSLGGEFTDGFFALMADGSVRFIKHGISDKILRAYITGKPPPD